MLSLDDINKRFAAPDGALPGLYGARLASDSSLDVAGGHFVGGVSVRPINGHTLRRLVASGYPVAAAWRVTMTGADLMREVAGPEKLAIRKLAGEAEFFEGDVFASLPPTRLKDEKPKKPKKPPQPPKGVVVEPATPPPSAPLEPKGEPTSGSVAQTDTEPDKDPVTPPADTEPATPEG